MPSPIKNHHDKKNVLQDDGSSIQVSSSDLKSKGVDAIKSQMLKIILLVVKEEGMFMIS